MGRKARVWSAPNPAVGCVLVRDGQLLASGFTHPTGQQHAEVHALSQIDDAKGATAYVTLEPCVMCIGALIHARVQTLKFASYDSKDTAVSCVDIANLSSHNHKLSIEGGVMDEEAGKLLKNFFKKRRKN